MLTILVLVGFIPIITQTAIFSTNPYARTFQYSNTGSKPGPQQQYGGSPDPTNYPSDSTSTQQLYPTNQQQGFIPYYQPYQQINSVLSSGAYSPPDIAEQSVHTVPNTQDQSSSNNDPNIQRRSKFESFKMSNGKYYENPDMETYRFGVFQDNNKKIDQFNSNSDQSYKKGIN